jgi:hypothetical protein
MNENLEKTITYVYEAKEVYLTGRVASNKKKPMMVEVLPIGTDDKTYAKWVKMDELLTITNFGDDNEII